jgi:hypothetical protein
VKWAIIKWAWQKLTILHKLFTQQGWEKGISAESGRSWQFFTNCSLNKGWKKESPRTLVEVDNSSQIVRLTGLRKKESLQSAHMAVKPGRIIHYWQQQQLCEVQVSNFAAEDTALQIRADYTTWVHAQETLSPWRVCSIIWTATHCVIDCSRGALQAFKIFLSSFQYTPTNPSAI